MLEHVSLFAKLEATRGLYMTIPTAAIQLGIRMKCAHFLLLQNANAGILTEKTVFRMRNEEKLGR